jgi:hypothetical protein
MYSRTSRAQVIAWCTAGKAKLNHSNRQTHMNSHFKATLSCRYAIANSEVQLRQFRNHVLFSSSPVSRLQWLENAYRAELSRIQVCCRGLTTPSVSTTTIAGTAAAATAPLKLAGGPANDCCTDTLPLSHLYSQVHRRTLGLSTKLLVGMLSKIARSAAPWR